MPIGLLPMIIYLCWWIGKRKPYHRYIVHHFPQCGFTVRVKRW